MFPRDSAETDQEPRHGWNEDRNWKCDEDGLSVFGTYHMHVVPWAHDPLRDGPTRLDTILGHNSNLFSFIVSLVDVADPRIRAFYEGSEDKEVPIVMEQV